MCLSGCALVALIRFIVAFLQVFQLLVHYQTGWKLDRVLCILIRTYLSHYSLIRQSDQPWLPLPVCELLDNRGILLQLVWSPISNRRCWDSASCETEIFPAVFVTCNYKHDVVTIGHRLSYLLIQV